MQRSGSETEVDMKLNHDKFAFEMAIWIITEGFRLQFG